MTEEKATFKSDKEKIHKTTPFLNYVEQNKK